MYEFRYGYGKTKPGEKAKLCYMDTEMLSVYITTDDISKDILKDVELQTINQTDYYLKQKLERLLV